jgi:hypothetical protein
VYIATYHYKSRILTYMHRLIWCLINVSRIPQQHKKVKRSYAQIKKRVSKDHISLHAGINETDGKIYYTET